MPPSDATASEVTHRDGELGVRAHWVQKSDAKGWRFHDFEARARKYPACDSHPENDVLLQGALGQCH